MDGPDARVAVVMITYNRRPEVLRTLAQLVALPEKPQVVVVDNGSTDGTVAAVVERFPNVAVISAGRNLGAAGRSLGVRHVTAPYIAFCDDDSWWRPGGLRRAADLFDRHPRLAVLTGRTLVGSEEVEDPICQDLLNSPLPVDGELPGPAVLGFLAGASIVRRAAYLEVGGFSQRVLVGGEEEWLAADLAVRGWALCYVPELVIHHHPSERRNVYARRWQAIRNTLWFTWLRRPLSSALRRTLWLARTAPRDWMSVHGFAAALAGLPWLLGERRVVPPNVERSYRLLDPS